LESNWNCHEKTVYCEETSSTSLQSKTESWKLSIIWKEQHQQHIIKWPQSTVWNGWWEWSKIRIWKEFSILFSVQRTLSFDVLQSSKYHQTHWFHSWVRFTLSHVPLLFVLFCFVLFCFVCFHYLFLFFFSVYDIFLSHIIIVADFLTIPSIWIMRLVHFTLLFLKYNMWVIKFFLLYRIFTGINTYHETYEKNSNRVSNNFGRCVYICVCVFLIVWCVSYSFLPAERLYIAIWNPVLFFWIQKEKIVLLITTSQWSCVTFPKLVHWFLLWMITNCPLIIGFLIQTLYFTSLVLLFHRNIHI
jgi:hypothetical protein